VSVDICLPVSFYHSVSFIVFMHFYLYDLYSEIMFPRHVNCHFFHNSAFKLIFTTHRYCFCFACGYLHRICFSITILNRKNEASEVQFKNVNCLIQIALNVLK
jgi:hypothetical protein